MGTRPGAIPGGGPAPEGLTPEPPGSRPLSFHLCPQRKWVFQELGRGWGDSWLHTLAEEVTQAPGEKVSCPVPPPPPSGWAELGLPGARPPPPGPSPPWAGGEFRLGPDSPLPCLDPWGPRDSGPHCVKLGQIVLFSTCVYGKPEVSGGCCGKGVGGPPNLLSQARIVHTTCALGCSLFSPFLWGFPSQGSVHLEDFGQHSVCKEFSRVRPRSVS